MSGKRAALEIILVIFLLNISTPLVNAYYATTYDLSYTQDLEPDTNGHTYVYTEYDPTRLYDYSRVTYSDEMHAIRYHYGDDRWWLSSSSLPGVGTAEVPFQESWYTMSGWLDNYTFLPSFYDFINTTNTYDLTAVDRMTLFGMPINQEVSLIAKTDRPYFGTFNVTDEEFFHLQITSNQDGTTFMIYVFDSQGRRCGGIGIIGGDRDVLAFAPSGPGMYYIAIYAYGEKMQFSSLTLLLQPITPEVIDFGEVVEGVLEGSEFIVKEGTGDMVHQEKVPTARTFKVSSNTSTPALVEYAINSPELDNDIYQPFMTRIEVTSDSVFLPSGNKYETNPASDGGLFYYQSFQGEAYYITIIGMEETSYSFYHWVPDVPELPISTPIYLEANRVSEKTFAFKLSVAHDSLIKVNTTDPVGFEWTLFTVTDDHVYRSIYLDSDSFEDAKPDFIPAGNYLVVGTTSSISPILTTFNVGPVIDGAGTVAVDVGNLVGLRVPTEVLQFYEVNVTLLNHANITTGIDIDLFNNYGGNIRNVDVQLGNQQSGTQWIAFGDNRTSIYTGLPTYYDLFAGEYGIISISPHSLSNNTSGLSPLSGTFSLSFNVSFSVYRDRAFNGTASWTHGSTDWVNITLGEPGDTNEVYLLEMNTVEGTWYNITYLTEDVQSIDDINAYQMYEGNPQILRYLSLDDTLVGDASKGNFQFGAASDKVYLLFSITRATGSEGSFDILITPFTTNTYQYPPMPRYVQSSTGGTAVPGIDPIVLAGAVGLVAVVVVVVVVKKKRGAGA